MNSKYYVVILACLFVLFINNRGTHSENNVIYVNAHAFVNNNNGSSWEKAFLSLQTALLHASEGQEIWVAAGTYTPASKNSGDRVSSFVLKEGVAIYGGFIGDESSRSERNWAANHTILSGDVNQDDKVNLNINEPTRQENSYHVVVGSHTDQTAVLDGFIISGGHANDASINDGGGFYAESNGPGPTLENIIFTENLAQDDGGAIFLNDSNLSLHKVIIDHNLADDGGGLYSTGDNNSPKLSHVEIKNNLATDNGGGVLITGNNNSAIFSNTTFINNSAQNHGGALYTLNSKSFYNFVTFKNNTAGKEGGGMYNKADIGDTSAPKLTNVVFEKNEAEDGAGMTNTNDTSSPADSNLRPILTNVTFHQNTATKNGGGMRNKLRASASSFIRVTMTNVTFSNNLADRGGAIFSDKTFGFDTRIDLNLNFATIIHNRASDVGGGIFNEDNGSTVTLKNSILAHNITKNSQISECEGSIDLSSTNIMLTQNLGNCTLNITGNLLTEDPLLQVQENQGIHSPIYVLSDDSPAIDSGDCTDLNNNDVSTDLRGFLRPYGASCDLGSFEWPVGVVYISAIMKDFCEFCETEPNGEDDSANGPLLSNHTYFGKFPDADDLRDYYYFELPSTHKTTVWLTNIGDGFDYDLAIFDENLVKVAESGKIGSNDEEILNIILAPGKYYVLVTNPLRTESNQFYNLKLVYE